MTNYDEIVQEVWCILMHMLFYFCGNFRNLERCSADFLGWLFVPLAWAGKSKARCKIGRTVKAAGGWFGWGFRVPSPLLRWGGMRKLHQVIITTLPVGFVLLGL